MFTGITEQVGKIESLEHSNDGGRLRISFGSSTTGAASEIARETKLGDSISVNGCCLTVVEFDSKYFIADLSGETLRRTNFGEKKPGNLANLERPLAAGARLGGHFMQGHVDGIGRVTRLVAEGDNWWLSVRVPEDLRRYVAEKGSIAIDGISLTVARWHDGIADIAIIPFTYQHTNVQAMSPNDAVNLETDILAKYVESLLHQEKSVAASHLTVKHLVEEGF
jgi:riboflavin synthase